ncbi:MAG: amidohydrolase family protein [Tunicatimonas sp.]
MPHLRLFILFLLSLPTTLRAQVPAPAPPQSQPILLLGGTAHLGTGEVIDNAAVAFSDGKLTAVGPASSVPDNERSSYQVIDVSGRHVYPGFILPDTDLGLVEISAVRATVDNAEAGTLNPNVRSLISYNTDSELIPTFRFNGILLAQIVPQSGLMPGTSSVVQLDAWNWEDAAVAVDNALHLHWPRRFGNKFNFVTFTVMRERNENYDEQIRAVRTLFADAQAYIATDPETPNLKLEALRSLLNGSQTLFLHSDDAREIMEAVLFAEEYGVKKLVLVGGSGLLAVKEFIQERKLPVVIENVHQLPPHPDSPVDALYSLANDLQQAGILVSLAYNEGMTARSRSLAFLAGTAAAYGLEKEEALKLITANPAQMLGIADRVGTLEVGKQATLFVSAGDALDMRTNRLTHAFIDGRQITLPAMQQELYQKYKTKYENNPAGPPTGKAGE